MKVKAENVKHCTFDSSDNEKCALSSGVLSPQRFSEHEKGQVESRPRPLPLLSSGHLEACPKRSPKSTQTHSPN